MRTILATLVLTLITPAAFAANTCTKPEIKAMKRAVYAGMTAAIGISNTEEEFDGVDSLREDYLMTDANVAAVIAFAAKRLNKTPVTKPWSQYVKVKDLWTSFCTPL